MLTLPATLGEIKRSVLLALQQQQTALNLPQQSGDFGGGARLHVTRSRRLIYEERLKELNMNGLAKQ